jgi:hypothetical protein
MIVAGSDFLKLKIARRASSIHHPANRRRKLQHYDEP